MPCEILVINVAKDPYIRGEPVVIKDSPAVWGTKEGLPNWVRLAITDATAAQVIHYLNPVKALFEYEVLNQTAAGARIRISADSAVLTVYEAGMRQEMHEYLQAVWGAVYQPTLSNPPLDYVLDFPNPTPSGDALELPKLQDDFEDKFVEVVNLHRYYFSAADMDAAVAAGGYYELTAAQAANRIIDKLA